MRERSESIGRGSNQFEPGAKRPAPEVISSLQSKYKFIGDDNLDLFLMIPKEKSQLGHAINLKWSSHLAERDFGVLVERVGIRKAQTIMPNNGKDWKVLPILDRHDAEMVDFTRQTGIR